MLKNKMYWLKDSGNVPVEIRQAKDEGRQIEKLLPLAEELSAMPEGEEKEQAARKLLIQLENAPQAKDWPYEEPEDYEGIVAASEGGGCMIRLPKQEREDRIRGAWVGRAAGCLLGIPVEGWMRGKIRGYLEESGQYPLSGYIRSDVAETVRKKYGIQDVDEGTPYDRQMFCWINNVDRFPADDDTNYTTLALRVLERKGLSFTSDDVAEAWVFAIPAFHTCTAERVAYRNLMSCVTPPQSGRYLNPYREWIGAQIRADFYGYIAAGNPRLAAEMAYRDAVVAQTKNGVYAAMYIAAVIAAAAVLPDPMDWVREGMKQIPRKSRLYTELKRLLAVYADGAADCAQMFGAIYEKYDESNTFDWCLAISNALIVTACILVHGKDYSKAVTQAVSAGFDTDCNGATVGSIVGIACGYRGIDSKWKVPVKEIITSSVNSYHELSVDDIVARTIAILEQVEKGEN